MKSAIQVSKVCYQRSIALDIKVWNVGLMQGIACRNCLIKTFIITYILATGKRSQRSKCDLSRTKISVRLRWNLMVRTTTDIGSMSLVMKIKRSMLGNEASIACCTRPYGIWVLILNIYTYPSQSQANLLRGSRDLLNYRIWYFREDSHILNRLVLSSREDLTMSSMIMYYYPLETI